MADTAQPPKPTNFFTLPGAGRTQPVLGVTQTYKAESHQTDGEGDGCGGASITLGAGAFFHGPRGQVHGFRNPGPDAAKLLVFISAATGIEAMFAGLSDLTLRHPDAIDPAEVASICGAYGVTFVR
jgi:hypothetical protein